MKYPWGLLQDHRSALRDPAPAAPGGLTILLAEQSIPLVLDIADYAYVLQTGRTVLEGKAADLQKNEQVQEIYLGIRPGHGAEGEVGTT